MEMYETREFSQDQANLCFALNCNYVISIVDMKTEATLNFFCNKIFQQEQFELMLMNVKGIKIPETFSQTHVAVSHEVRQKPNKYNIIHNQVVKHDVFFAAEFSTVDLIRFCYVSLQ